MLASVDAFSGNLSVNGGVVYGKPGTTGKLDIYLNNTDSKIEVVQFDLVVPAGVTLDTRTYIGTKNQMRKSGTNSTYFGV